VENLAALDTGPVVGGDGQEDADMEEEGDSLKEGKAKKKKTGKAGRKGNATRKEKAKSGKVRKSKNVSRTVRSRSRPIRKRRTRNVRRKEEDSSSMCFGSFALGTEKISGSGSGPDRGRSALTH